MNAGHVAVPAGSRGPVTVVRGPRLLAGVGERSWLPTHRSRWPEPARARGEELARLAEAVDVRGRGGAGFPLARKLRTALESGRRRVVVVNAAEGEPGSAKDCALLLTAPHLVLDGAELAARALGTSTVHVVVPGERPAVRPALEAAVEERGRGIRFQVAQTSGGFVGGQARAVLELLAGRDNLPVTAWTPEAVSGLRGRPTLLSNAETFAQLAALVALGPQDFAQLGTAQEPGTTLLTIAGDSHSAIVLEVPLGVRLADVLTHCRHDPRSPVLMGGYHGVWLPPHQVLSRRVSRLDLTRVGATLGAGVVLPVSGQACPVALTARVVSYLASQSARRCGPCRNGLPALARACTDLAEGIDSVPRLHELIGVLPGRGACAHPDGTVRMVRSLVDAFPEEIQAHRYGGCPVGVRVA